MDHILNDVSYQIFLYFAVIVKNGCKLECVIDISVTKLIDCNLLGRCLLTILSDAKNAKLRSNLKEFKMIILED